ncbi:MAG: hypothetical protein J5I59_07520 [Saprospiraceae bacterium]|nr:hypothetical protein [Saprospiraceae bacterium]
MKKVYFIFLWALVVMSCNPQSDKDITLGPLPQSPEFSVEFLPTDSNKIVVTDLSSGNFIRLWTFSEGSSKGTSNLVSDTIFFPKKGDYTITLYISQTGGNGTASNSKIVHISKDASLPCSGPISLLTGNCSTGGKCWKFSTEAGAITVGETYGASNWYKSPANGLVASQYDDRYCFVFDGFKFDYQNQGFTVNPFSGYVDEPYTPVPGPFIFSPGTGPNGEDQIILTKGQFMGTRDSYSELNIIKLTETELWVRAQFADKNGEKVTPGWFEFKYVAE